MKCDMTIQTEVALQNIKYVSNLGLGPKGPDKKKVKKTVMKLDQICTLQTVIKKSFLGHICAKNSDLGHFYL